MIWTDPGPGIIALVGLLVLAVAWEFFGDRE